MQPPIGDGARVHPRTEDSADRFPQLLLRILRERAAKLLGDEILEPGNERPPVVRGELGVERDGAVEFVVFDQLLEMVLLHGMALGLEHEAILECRQLPLFRHFVSGGKEHAQPHRSAVEAEALGEPEPEIAPVVGGQPRRLVHEQGELGRGGAGLGDIVDLGDTAELGGGEPAPGLRLFEPVVELGRGNLSLVLGDPLLEHRGQAVEAGASQRRGRDRRKRGERRIAPRPFARQALPGRLPLLHQVPLVVDEEQGAADLERVVREPRLRVVKAPGRVHHQARDVRALQRVQGPHGGVELRLVAEFRLPPDPGGVHQHELAGRGPPGRVHRVHRRAGLRLDDHPLLPESGRGEGFPPRLSSCHGPAPLGGGAAWPPA